MVFLKSKKAYLFLILIFIPLGTLNSQSKGSPPSLDADSIIAITDTLKTGLQKIKILTSNAGANRYVPETRRLINKALEISIREENPELLANAYYSLGNYYYYNAKTDSCLSSLNKALTYLEEYDDPLLNASVLSSQGGAYSKLGAVILAISTNIEAKKILDGIDSLTLDEEQIHKLKGRTLVLNNSLANLYSQTEDYEAALSYYEQAYEAALILGSKPNAAIILSNKGDLLLKMDRLEEGLKVLEESKAKKMAAGLPSRFIAGSDLNIGIAHFKMGNFELSLQSYNSALENNRAKGNTTQLMQAITERGILYNALGRYAEAKADCEEGKGIAKEINNSEYIIKSCECLHKSYLELGDFERSLDNHIRYTKTKDSVFNEKNIRKITQVGMQYEFDKKEAEQQLLLAKKNRQKNQILAGLITLGIFALMLFIFFRKRLKYQRTIASQKDSIQQQKIVELQQHNKLTAMSSMIEGQEAERLRIAKDLHDSLGGLLSTVKAHFTSIQKEITQLAKLNITEKTNELIDEACIEVRRISHNMMPHALSISGLPGAVEDMVENLKDQGYEVTLEINNMPEEMDNTRKVMLYRLLQEIISNVRKHAEAKSILIQLLGYKNEIHLIVEDDGKGFDLDQATGNGGLGLKSINSRVEFLDGKIHWDTQPGQGTTLSINIPSGS
ncbi:sensor histidine kinase [Aureisphaera galaxeae]|uniref:tetratricopeptide repeat-containing sensor histidine kinase n=1 Tax=Aureisphaera galaxeae TaxID=1538023 RepID=UPI00234FCB1F|nr:sensor histidine kinase [Aureisphaera galaxeae]MDC8005524.1 sensor histidine kinase [Aureisphaera galaxeae]